MAYSNNYSKEEQKALAKEKVEKALAKVNRDIVSVFNSDEFPKYLSFAANFHYFDVNNTLLIYKQRPSAKFLASFKVWGKYNVESFGDPNRPIFPSSQKGKGVGILAPYILKKKVPGGDGQKDKVISYIDYHVVFVFDKEQTNGIPTPVMAWDLSRSQQDSAALFSALNENAPFGICFSNEVSDAHKCSYEPPSTKNARGRVILNQADANNFYMLCSYIIKMYVVHSLKNLQEKHSKEDYHKICECVAFMLASYFGLPTEENPLFFAKLWGNNNPEKMMAILNVVQLSAHKLINSLEEEMIFYKSINDIDDIYDNDGIFEFNNFYDF